MSLAKWTTSLLVAVCAIAAQPPLPDLRVEPTTGGSVFYVRNTYSQPLTAFLIELVGYPGSSYALWQDDFPAVLDPGAEKRIPVTSMTVGAVPEYVKIQAAVYADGTSSGVPEKVAQIIDRRRSVLETVRELIRRIEKKSDKAAVIADLNQWAASLRPAASAARSRIIQTARTLEEWTLERTLEMLVAAERMLSASKPPLQ